VGAQVDEPRGAFLDRDIEPAASRTRAHLVLWASSSALLASDNPYLTRPPLREKLEFGEAAE
jgi:hypothetical protein